MDTLKSPQKGCARLVADQARLPMLGMILGTNFLLLMFTVWRFVGILWTAITDLIPGAALVGVNFDEIIEYPFGCFLLTGLVLCSVFVGLYGLSVFLGAKIAKKNNVGILDGMVAAAGYTIWPTGIMLVGLMLSILGDFGANMFILCAILAIWVWAVLTADGMKEIAGLNTAEGSAKMGIVIGIRVVCTAISVWLTWTMLGWCIENIKIMGQTLGDMSELMENLIGSIGDIF